MQAGLELYVAYHSVYTRGRYFAEAWSGSMDDLMPRSELGRMLGSIPAVVVSYAAAFWLLDFPHHDLSPLPRLGWVCALYCAVGVGGFFWSEILAFVARKRQWSPEGSRHASYLILIPGSVLLLAGTSKMWIVNLLLYQSLFVGLRVRKLVHPDADQLGPFERNAPFTLFPK